VRALTVRPGVAGSAQVADTSFPPPGEGELEVEALLVGVCGTDREIVDGDYGVAPADADRLTLGHEALGRIIRAPAGCALAVGSLVVPVVRRPDPVPCSSCAVGEWDMCRNGRYTEHGIHGAHGYARDTFGLDPAFAVTVPEGLGDLGVLVEPASVVAKAWEQIDRIGARAHRDAHTALITGAGPVGLLAALLARQRGYDTHVLDRVTDGPKPGLVADLGATYHHGTLADACDPPDVIVECTGVGTLVLDAIAHTAAAGIVCLAGLSSGAHTIELDPAALNRTLVLENDVVFGTVNANLRHYQAAVDALSNADPAWLARLLSRRVPLDDFADAFRSEPDDVKVVLDLGHGPASGQDSAPAD
jgi:threonine dehydrogenase-like Zn-dependent dehydrogenase